MMRLRIVGLSLAVGVLTALAGAQAQGAKAPARHGATAHMPSTATTFFVVFKVKPGKAAEFKRVFRHMEARVRRNEPGNLSYDLYRNGMPHTYVIIERYRNRAAVAAHGRDARNLMSELKDTLGGPPRFQALTLVSSK